ncbi:MAG: radical SAM protein [Candidatus Lokiarchaeota archaeon]
MMKYSVGIGLTNNCNLSCPHCYRNKEEISYLSLEQIKILYKSIPIKSIGMGTGENILNPEFHLILNFLSSKNVNLSLASNGLTLTSLSDEELKLFNDVEVSIDFPTEKEQNEFRGKGNWKLVMKSIERCKNLGVNISILTTIMSINHNKMGSLIDLARAYNTNLRTCVYQSVNSDEYQLSYNQFWKAIKELLEFGELISCSEPVVRAVLGLEPVFSPCGHKSIRINPKGQISPCVYFGGLINSKPLPTIKDLPNLGEDIINTYYFKKFQKTPKEAKSCRCKGGCSSRRALKGNLNTHDFYCPWVRGEEINLSFTKVSSSNLVRSDNNCNIIVK